VHVEFFAKSNDYYHCYYYYKQEDLRKNVLNIDILLFATIFV
jgi:hypothetical protein